MRTASTAAKPYQEDSSEFYLITGSIYIDQQGTVVFPMMAAARRGRVRFIAACSYSTDIHKDIMKSQDTNIELTDFADAYRAGCQDTRRSTSGSAQCLGEKLMMCTNLKDAITTDRYDLYSTDFCIVTQTSYQLDSGTFHEGVRQENDSKFLFNRLGMQSITPKKLKSLVESEE
ncbi:hypothetical protein Tco_0703394 [Tanacetum coccineum]|uniref:Uncharacterized protein n=1 Tax=Tanacetum coccineum TaxID=301880 RepID=A0ABQ4Y093_9ASTR